jgi:2-polyprenyl-6-hydroxyphenyl methylase/3-demethylubiquinone-9 3-methyltransferase
MTDTHAQEVAQGARFEFGDNWARFLVSLDESRIEQAEESLLKMLGRQSLAGLRFLDVGSGSGLFSLAARRLGATVRSFDYDPQSVACTRELKLRYFKDDPNWTVEEGSVLDIRYLSSLGQFDIVYSWGVLHHTGQMWQALGNVAPSVASGGQLFIAIYNDQGWISRYWLRVKQLYVQSRPLRWPLLLFHAPYLYGARWLARRLTRRSKLQRGMVLWRDMVDWVGGYPFEVARPEAIFNFYRDKGFTLSAMTTCGGRHGCNEFVLARDERETA